MKKNSILIPDTPKWQVAEQLMAFPSRYGCHKTKKAAGRWKLDFLQKTKDGMIFQLVDLDFEPPRGRVPSDQPVLCISLEQVGNDTLLWYTFRWLGWKIFLMSALFLAIACLDGYVVYSVMFSVEKTTLLQVIIGSFLTVLLGIWLVQNIHHDRLAQIVFIQILNKNFPTAIWRNTGQKPTDEKM